MAELMGYCMLIALLMGLEAIGLERVLVLRDIPRRAISVIALAASLLYPAYRIFSPSFISLVVVRPTLDVEPSTSIDSSSPATAPIVVTPAEMPVHRVAIAQTNRRFTAP